MRKADVPIVLQTLIAAAFGGTTVEQKRNYIDPPPVGTLVQWDDRQDGVRTGVLVEYRTDTLESNGEVFSFNEQLEYMRVRSHDEDRCIPAGYPFDVPCQGPRGAP